MTWVTLFISYQASMESMMRSRELTETRMMQVSRLCYASFPFIQYFPFIWWNCLNI